MVPGPPYIGLSKQYRHLPQFSVNTHPVHSPHFFRRRRGFDVCAHVWAPLKALILSKSLALLSLPVLLALLA